MRKRSTKATKSSRARGRRLSRLLVKHVKQGQRDTIASLRRQIERLMGERTSLHNECEELDARLFRVRKDLKPFTDVFAAARQLHQPLQVLSRVAAEVASRGLGARVTR